MAQGTAVQSSVPEPEPPIDAPEPPVDDQLQPDGHDAEAATEARAREMGWKPLSEYRGPPGRWQPAADFIQRGENILPIVRDQNRRLTERVSKLDGEVTGLRTTVEEQLQIIKDLRDRGLRADQRGYERAMAEIKAKQRQAVEQGDTAAYDRLVDQAEALEDGHRQAAAATPPAPAQPAAPASNKHPPTVSQATKDFVDSNPWFTSDAFLNRKMIDQHIDVLQEGQIADEAAQYAEAKRRVMEDYPERFGVAPAPQPAPPARPAARRRATVAAPTPAAEPPRNSGAATTINSIQDPTERAEAREAFNRTKRQLPDYTESEFMALYENPRGDVLAMHKQQQQPRRT